MQGDNSILWFEEISIEDKNKVGGKNASLGEMYSNLTDEGIPIPNGFAITANAYRDFIKKAGIRDDIKNLLKQLDTSNVEQLEKTGKKIRKLIYKSELPENIKKEIKSSFKQLQEETEKGGDLQVAVRSSATAEDLPQASFAGQQDTFLNINEEKYLIKSVKKCMASIFTDRAISYREAQGFDHLEIACSVGVQQMVDAEEGSSGVMFTMDTESGFDGVVLINSSYGYGEYVVKGRVNPDQFYVFKEGLKKGKDAIISKKCGSKEVKLIKGKNRDTKQKRVKQADRDKLSLSDEDVLQLSEWGMKIEDYYGQPQDIEWSKDGETGQLYILQSRPETVKSRSDKRSIEKYKLKQEGEVLVKGSAIGRKIGAGKVKVLNTPKQKDEFRKGDVLVTKITNPDWEPIMEIASAIVTEQGGKTSHAAIVARELGIPALVGAESAKKELEDEKEVTVDCSQGDDGFVYKGRLPFEVEKTEITNIPVTSTDVMMNIANPDHAFDLAALPNDGVGLARLEFIFNNSLGIHPLALVNYEEQNKEVKKEIDKRTKRFNDKEEYCIEKLSEGIGRVATAFYPNKTIVRLSDFKSNEYKRLIGGEKYEPEEENPMLGWRGASRYYSDKYKPAFRLECQAIKRAREEWGLENIIVMVPFCRTPQEGKKVLKTMKEFGLKQGENGLKVYAMCEIPSNVVLAEEFAQIFDGISIGSNDLTQMTLGVDRDSASVNELYDENNPAVKKMISEVIRATHKYQKPVSICGQAPSDSLSFVKFLIREDIDSISLNPDVMIKTIKMIDDIESTIGNTGDKTNSKLLVLLVVVGILAAVLIAMGGGCSARLPGSSNEDLDMSSNNLNPAQIREKTEDRINKKYEQRLKEKMVEVEINSFADIQIGKPIEWRAKYTNDKVVLTDTKNEGFIEIFSTSSESGLTTSSKRIENFEELEINENKAVRYSTIGVGDENHVENKLYQAVEILASESSREKEVIVVRGVTDRFDEITETIKLPQKNTTSTPS